MALPEEGNVSPFRPQPLSRPLTAADYMAYNPTIILNSEGSGNPGTAPTGLRKTSRVYYRKADLTDGAELKASFGDVNIGNLSLIHI